MPQMNVLSIDFDYFQNVSEELIYDYPDGVEMDNDLSTIVWARRMVGNEAIGKVKILNEEYNDVIRLLTRQNNVKCIMISQSHADIYDFIKDNVTGKQIAITNIDMHHDMFNDKEEVDCGNWLGHIAKEYDATITWVENPISRKVYSVKEDPFSRIRSHVASLAGSQYDLIFLCRSNTWLPPHLDKKFDELKNFLIYLAQKRYHCNGYLNQEVEHPRDYRAEIKHYKQFDKQMKVLEKYKKELAKREMERD